MSDVPNRDLEIFTAAIELPGGERAAFLERICGVDGEQRQRFPGFLIWFISPRSLLTRENPCHR
jgi:hypothetical protein